jgi:hypothetical protein
MNKYYDFKAFVILTGRLPRSNAFEFNERKIANWFLNNLNTKMHDKIRDLIIKYNNFYSYGFEFVMVDYFNIEVNNWIALYGDTQFTIKSRYSRLELEMLMWHNNLIVEYKNRIIPQYKINIMSKIPRWSWNTYIILNNRVRLCDHKFIDNYFNWLYCKDNPESIIKKKSIQWQNRIRYYYRKQKLSVVAIDILNNTIGWTWETDDIFLNTLEKWKKFYNKHGRTPYRKDNEKERKLAYWQVVIRTKYRKNKLCKEKIDILNSVYGWKWEQTFQKVTSSIYTLDNFDIFINNFIEFYDYRKIPSIYSEDLYEKNLALYRYNILYLYKNGKLAKNILEKINKLPFDFFELYYKIVTFKYNFEDNVYLWKYFNDNKKFIYKDIKYLEQQIIRWQYKIRNHCKHGLLSLDKIFILNNTEDWKWACYETKDVKFTFNENAALWKNFYLLNKRSPIYKIEKERKLKNWQSYIIRRYKNKKLSEEQVNLLNSIEGWKWNSR